MHTSPYRKTFTAILAFTPPVALFILLQAPDLLVGWVNETVRVVGLIGFLYYVADVATDDDMTIEKKGFWIISFIFLAGLALPLYWILYIASDLRQEKPLPQPRTKARHVSTEPEREDTIRMASPFVLED